jgi:hypothetical protein
VSTDRPGGAGAGQPVRAPLEELPADAPVESGSTDDAPLLWGRLRRDGPVVRAALVAAVIVFIVLPIFVTFALLTSGSDLSTLLSKQFNSLLSEIGNRL